MTSSGNGPPMGGYPANNPDGMGKPPAPGLNVPNGKSLRRGSAAVPKRLGENPTFDVGLDTDLGTAVDCVVADLVSVEDAGVFLLPVIGEDLGEEELWLLLHRFPLTTGAGALLLPFEDGVLALLLTDPLSSGDSSLLCVSYGLKLVLTGTLSPADMLLPMEEAGETFSLSLEPPSVFLCLSNGDISLVVDESAPI